MIILIIIIFILVIGLIIYNKQEHFNNNELKIINLVLYSDNLYYYNEMYKITSNYYKKFNNVTTIYYKYDKNLDENILLKDDILYIKGSECYIPCILDKTIKSLQYIRKNYDYDYIVRSNISTLINFNKLTPKLMEENVDYGGGIKVKLNKINEYYGNIDNKYLNMEYAGGTAIILSQKMVDNILKFKNKLRMDIIDDVSIGIFINDYFKNVKIKYFDNYFGILYKFKTTDEQIIFIKSNDYIFYRNRSSDDRISDIEQLKILVKTIS